ncbi:hypothetical protein DPMN_194902 [Dreissena polymorpha]|uniref:Uncharacterized protein n=1 Tax=Dreissena polymorpha TaxID=45954 RepID=A0A9D4BED4_DREPO|nr:hypothetical protein DPMN_194902 [Dreissena polymorpha]
MVRYSWELYPLYTCTFQASTGHRTGQGRELLYSQGNELMSYNHIMVRYSGDHSTLYTHSHQASIGHKTGQGREYKQSGE